MKSRWLIEFFGIPTKGGNLISFVTLQIRAEPFLPPLIKGDLIKTTFYEV
jgi:hypothetical protein